MALPFEKRSPPVYGSVHTIPVSAIRFDIGYYYTESVQCQDTVNIAYNNNLLYKILINKIIIKITYVTTSMPILHDLIVQS